MFNLTDVTIDGKGAIDGSGARWWRDFLTHDKQKRQTNPSDPWVTRPHLLEIYGSDRVKLLNVTFMNSPFWTVHPVYSSNVFAAGINISNPVDGR